MKKVLFFAAALAVVSLTSCGKGDKNAEATDSTANTEVGGVPADTAVTAEGVVTVKSSVTTKPAITRIKRKLNRTIVFIFFRFFFFLSSRIMLSRL